MAHDEKTASTAGLRRRLSSLFDDDGYHSRIKRYFNAALALLIVANVGAILLETVEPIRVHHEAAFAVIEHVATGVFAAEYLLRLWTAVDLHDERFRHPVWGRLRYACSFFAIIDLIGILPALLGLLGADDLRVLRLLRLLRMLKLTRHSTVFGLIWSVLREEAHATGALVFILCLTVTTSGSLMYMIEGERPRTLFTSIPASMWWAIETLTTVGYGDMIPETVAGRLLGGAVIVIGIVTLALFSGLITVSFIDRLRVRREKAIARRVSEGILQGRHDDICPHCGHVLGHKLGHEP